MVKLPFWKAFDRVFLDEIAHLNGNANQVLLEMGGGTGRFSLPLSTSFRQILSFDISEAMVRTALRKRADRGAVNASYFVADAERIPVRSQSADVALVSGILHHVERPAEVVAHMARVLRPGGRFIGNENNRSAFRPVFDFLMRVRKLWNEKAHEEHFVMSGRELKEWFAGSGVRSRIWTSVFLPPHVYNLFSEDAAWRLLRTTDAMAAMIPWLKSQGGLVLFEGEKPGLGTLDHTN
jgi:ubiquinone/menaquinone biosynthesis C-methylase UbiE